MRQTLMYVGIMLGTLIAACCSFVVYVALTDPPRNSVSAESMTDDKYTAMPNSQVGFQIRPNLASEDGRSSAAIYTDDRGARRDRAGQRAAATVDLITVGCSQAFGAGLENEQTFTSVLARRLNLRAANYSVSGYGGVGSLFRLKERLDQKPKVVIYGFWEDHLNRNVRRCAQIAAPSCLEMGRIAFGPDGKPHFVKPLHPERGIRMSRDYHRQTTTDSDRWRSFSTDLYWTAMRAVKNIDLGVRDPGDNLTQSDKIRAAQFVLGEMKKAADDYGFKLIVVYIPTYFAPVIQDAPPNLKSFAEKSGVTWISMAARLRELRRDGREFMIPNNGHLNALGHAVIADELAGALAK